MKPFAHLLFLILIQASLIPAHAQENNPLINSGALIDSGSALYDAGSYKKALELYRLVDRNDTNYIRALYETAITYYADSQFDEAIRYCETGFAESDADPERIPDLYDEYGNAIDASGNPERALLIFDTAIQKYPAFGMLYMNKATVLLNQKRNKEAEEVLQRGLLVDPYNYSSHYKLGLAALRQGKLIPAMLSFTAYLLLNPEGRYRSSCINILDQIAHNEDAIQMMLNNRKESPAGQYALLEQIVQSKIALDKNYKAVTHLDDPISRQIQVVFEKMETGDDDPDFWTQYYMPLFKSVYTSGRFEYFINQIFSGVDLPIIQEFLKKNKKEIAALKTDAGNYFDLIRQTRELWATKRNADSTGWFFSNGELLGKGKYQSNGDKLLGPWEFCFQYGNPKARGAYNDQGQKEGPWTYYSFKGGISANEFYHNGKQEGEATYFYDNGVMSSHLLFKEGELSGEATTYYRTGRTHIIAHYLAGKEDGEKKTCFENGAIQTVEHYKSGALDGTSRTWLQNGALENVSEYKNGKQEGSFKKYYANGHVYSEGSYINDKQVGHWKYYYADGKLKAEQDLVNGDIDGDYKAYYENGVVSNACQFKKGKIVGDDRYYDEDGKLYSQIHMENGLMQSAQYLDKQGKLISQSDRRDNELNLTSFDQDGIKRSVAGFDKHDNLEGVKTYFFWSGKVKETETYSDGNLDGPDISYYANGVKKNEFNFKDGEKNGYYKEYYRDGVLKQEGWFVSNRAQGYWMFYDPLGKLTDSIYYLNDNMEGCRVQYLPNGKRLFEDFYKDGREIRTIQYDTLGNRLNTVDQPTETGPYKLIYANGNTYIKANYVQGNVDGFRDIFYFDGKAQEQSFYRNGLLDSTAKAYYHSGALHVESKYHLGDKTGTWKYFFPNGSLLESEEYRDDKLNGLVTYYFESGQKKQEDYYREDQKDSFSRVFDPGGSLLYQVNYKDGDPVSYTYPAQNGQLQKAIPFVKGGVKIKAFFADGKPSADLEFREGVMEGPSIYYFANGKTRSTATYQGGAMEGSLKTYHDNGQLQGDYTYLHDNLHGPYKEYNEKGILTEEGNYYNGDPNGFIKKYDDNGILKETDFYYFGKLLSIKK